MDLLPAEDGTLLEPRVAPVDIDEVQAGLAAEVHLLAYQSRNLPRVRGTVDGRRARAAERRLGRGGRPMGCAERAQDQAQLGGLIAFSRARKGKAYGFRFKD